MNHLWTLSALQNHPWALIVVDEDATAGTCSPLPSPSPSRARPLSPAAELHVKTVKYFKSIERVQEEAKEAHVELRAQGLEEGDGPLGGMV